MRRALPGILIGGVVGSSVRWGATEVGAAVSFEPANVLTAINALGCFVVGAAVARWTDVHDPRRLTLGLGFAGGLTTFSALAVEMAAGIHSNDYSPIVTSIPLQLLAGVVFFVVGRKTATT